MARVVKEYEKIYEGPLTKRIKVRVSENPKLIGSKARQRFDLYIDGMTVAEYYAACEAAGHVYRNYSLDIEWDKHPIHGFIALV
jgi:hypothetical protein